MENQLACLTLSGPDHDEKEAKVQDERKKREAATEYALNLCKQLDVLEDMLRIATDTFFQNLPGLRIYSASTFSIADLVVFAEGLENYARARGYATRIDTTKFHRQLARLWGQLDQRVQAKLARGAPISAVIEQLSQELVNLNKSWSTVPATFKFPDVDKPAGG